MSMSDYIRGIRSKVGNDLMVTPSAAIVAFDAERRVLLARHAAPDIWIAPGGMIEPNETPADAALREVWEETGTRVELVRVLGVYAGPDYHVVYTNGHEMTYVMTVFEGRLAGRLGRPDGRETLEIGLFSESEARTLNLGRGMPAVLRDAFARQSTAAFQPATWHPSDETR